HAASKAATIMLSASNHSNASTNSAILSRRKITGNSKMYLLSAVHPHRSSTNKEITSRSETHRLLTKTLMYHLTAEEAVLHLSIVEEAVAVAALEAAAVAAAECTWAAEVEA